MKKQKKHLFAVVLMASSILLLLVFQYFWLSQTYESEKQNLIKETNIIFIDVMSSLQDSLIRKSIKSSNVADSNFNYYPLQFPPPMFFKRDSPNNKQPNKIVSIHKNTKGEGKLSITFSPSKENDIQENVKILMPKGKLAKDSVKVMTNSEVQVFIASDKPQDSINMILQSVIRNQSQLPTQTKSFIIRITGDTISEIAVRQKLGRTLAKANIDLRFDLKKSNDRIQMRENFLFGKEFTQPKEGILTAPFFCIPPSPVYQAYFFDYQGFVLKKMLSPFFFSLALLLITSGAFLLIYHNLQKQERLIALKNDFISNVTHELKTPVTTVGVAIEALQSFNALQNPTLTQEYLEISKNELNRLAMLVDKIMKMASFESKGVELKLTQINVSELISQILKSMKLQFEKHQAEVTFEVVSGNTQKSDEVMLFADEVHLTNVIYNLLDNALKYSKEQPKIEVVLQDFRDKILLAVKDNGIGISKEYQEKVFDKFFRIPTGNLHNIKGYGLGLSYVLSVVQLHRGSIKVESKEGVGSEFIINLPKQKVA
jgi:two-component system, OmpR family, phosphate regulon sensor histidine kinase PhoR